MVDQQLAGLAALGDAPLAEQHLAHGGGIGQAQQHDVGLGTELGGGRHGPGAKFDQRLALVGRAVPDDQLITCGEQAATHRQAHQTDTGEGESWQIGHGRLLGKQGPDSSAAPSRTAM